MWSCAQIKKLVVAFGAAIGVSALAVTGQEAGLPVAAVAHAATNPFVVTDPEVTLAAPFDLQGEGPLSRTITVPIRSLEQQVQTLQVASDDPGVVPAAASLELAAGATEELQLTVSPQVPGQKEATVTVRSATFGGPEQKITVKYEATAKVWLALDKTEVTLDCVEAKDCPTLSQEVVLTNLGTQPVATKFISGKSGIGVFVPTEVDELQPGASTKLRVWRTPGLNTIANPVVELSYQVPGGNVLKLKVNQYIYPELKVNLDYPKRPLQGQSIRLTATGSGGMRPDQKLRLSFWVNGALYTTNGHQDGNGADNLGVATLDLVVQQPLRVRVTATDGFGHETSIPEVVIKPVTPTTTVVADRDPTSQETTPWFAYLAVVGAVLGLVAALGFAAWHLGLLPQG